MKRFIRNVVIAAVLGATAAATVGATQSTVDASKGPNKKQVVRLDATNTQKVAIPCATLEYPDGADMFTYCYEYASSSTPGKWYSSYRGTINVAYPAGHSDTMRQCVYGFQYCSSFADEGEQSSDHHSLLVNNSDTMWVEVDVKYGNVWYCRRAFGNNTGQIAFTTCP